MLGILSSAKLPVKRCRSTVKLWLWYNYFVGRIITGLIFLSVSFVSFIYPSKNVLFILFYSCSFGLGLLYIYDGIILKIRGKSLLIGGRRSILRHIFVVGLIGSVIIEAIGNWLFKTWIFPHFTTIEYLLIVVPFMSFYFFLLYENYLAIIIIIDKFKKFRGKEYRYSTNYKRLFALLGFFGVSIFIFTVSQRLSAYASPKNLLDMFNTYWYSNNNIVTLLLVFFSAWMIFEYLEYKRGEESFLLHLLKGDLVPFFAIIIGSLITSIIMEFFNLPILIWKYTNIPNGDILFLGIPLVVIILWPFQYLFFISLYHLIYKHETKRIWD